jgi:hypothetical protein
MFSSGEFFVITVAGDRNCISKACYASVGWSWFHVGSGPYSPDAPRPLLTCRLCPITIYGSPIVLPKLQMAPRLTSLIFSGSKKEPRYACLSEVKSSHRQRMWAEVSSSAPCFLHNEPSISLIRWRCLLRVLCPVRRSVTTLDCVLLKDRSLALVPRQAVGWSSVMCFNFERVHPVVFS